MNKPEKKDIDKARELYFKNKKLFSSSFPFKKISEKERIQVIAETIIWAKRKSEYFEKKYPNRIKFHLERLNSYLEATRIDFKNKTEGVKK